MSDKKIKELAQKSYTLENLDIKKILPIVKFLKREDFKKYIKELKNIENKTSVKVATSFKSEQEIPEEVKTNLKKLYPDKKIVYIHDPSLMLGLRIIDDDMDYEYNIKNTFEEMLMHIKEEL